MSDRIEHFFHFTPDLHPSQEGLLLSGDRATLCIGGVESFTDLIRQYGPLGQDGYFGTSLDSFQDCLNDSKTFWSVQPTQLEVVHLDVPQLPSSHLEAYVLMLIEAVIRYSTHEQHNQGLDPVALRRELNLNFPSMSEAQVEFYIAPIPTIQFHVVFPVSSKTQLQKVLDGHLNDIAHEIQFWKARGFILPERFTHS